MMRKNPLLQKEFRQRMRTTRAPIVITAYLASMGALTLTLLYESTQGQTLLQLAARSEQIFVALSWLQMTVVAFLTPAFAAGSISGERERRTLNVLLTTPLSPADILFGKILSSSALLLLLLVVTLPLYSLVFLFGGAVPQEVVAVLGFQLFTIVIIAALSVMWSTIAMRSGWSTVFAYATVAWMVLITGAVGYGLRILGAQNPMFEGMALKWSNDLLNLNPLWVEASLENAAQSSHPAGWLVFGVFYGGLAILMAIPCLLRLRPHGWRLGRS